MWRDVCAIACGEGARGVDMQMVWEIMEIWAK